MSEFNTGYLIGGELVDSDSDRWVETEDPARAEPLTQVPSATKSEVDQAVQAAKVQFEENWKYIDPEERGDILRHISSIFRRNEEYLIDIEVINNGSSRQSMKDDVQKAADRIEYFAGLIHEIKGETLETPGNTVNYTLREPIGVISAIIPFNHPLSFVGSKIGPALAAGNTIVIKPSEQTPLSALALAELIAADNEIPNGVVNIVAGDGKTGAHLTSHEDVGMVSFIGSGQTGTRVMKGAAENISPVLLELGGKNPSIVFPDADIPDAISGCANGMNLTWQGQSCGSGSRILVHADIHEEVVEGLVEHFENITVGMPNEEDADMGAMVSQTQYEHVLEYIELGKESDATLLTGGGPANVPESNGYFIEPTIFDDVDPNSRIAQEEIFGPVLSVITWTDYEEMLEIANGVEYGLTASVWTENLRTGMETANHLDVGYVWVNQHGPHYRGTPYGGVKKSGIGRTNCLREAIDHTRSKNVNVQLDRSKWEW